MELYNKVACDAARRLMMSYSTSFSSATKLFPRSIRGDIYNIYSVVRIADEIVDTHRKANSKKLLDDYEKNVYKAIKDGYSTDLILHAFQLTAVAYGIGEELIAPFFASMRFDIDPPKQLTQQQYETYIYGSAEVVGLMCLKVFCNGQKNEYKKLAGGAQALGAAFQKINFLRDYAHDTKQLDRLYFPDIVGDFNNNQKNAIIADIRKDLVIAERALKSLPKSIQPAVQLAHTYYEKLLNKLDKSSAEEILKRRIRIKNSQKLLLLTPVYVKSRIRS